MHGYYEGGSGKIARAAPAKELVWQLVSQLYQPGISKLKFNDAVAWLEQNGFLHPDSGVLLPRHEVYLPAQFFPDYADNDPDLNTHLEQLGDILLKADSPEDCASLAAYSLTVPKQNGYAKIAP